MALAYTVEKEAFTGLDEGTQQLYVEKDGKYFLDLDLESVTGHVKNDSDKIPKARLDAEILKRKEGETALAEVAEGFVNTVPEEMRDLIPDLPPAKKIKWIQAANAKGFFVAKETPPIDPKKPGGKPSTDFNNMNPVSIMAQGYKK